jgi:hypothetical protein
MISIWILPSSIVFSSAYNIGSKNDIFCISQINHKYYAKKMYIEGVNEILHLDML